MSELISGHSTTTESQAGAHTPRTISYLSPEAVTSIHLPALLAVISIGLMVNGHYGFTPLLIALAGLVLVLHGISVNRMAPADTVVLVGRTPMAAVLASTLGADGTRIVRANTLAEAARLVRAAACDKIIMAGSTSPYPVELTDSRGRRPSLIQGAEALEGVLQRIPLELVWNDNWLGRIGSIRPMAPRYASFKRGFDLLSMTVLAVILLPLLPLIALAIKLDSRGPVFYSQTRVGLGGALFRIHKFRTMRTDAEVSGAVWAEKDDPRITRVGRFLRQTRIDELPQIWNVLRGEMSLIGPRPERPEFTVELARHLPGYELRHTIKPGLTGWAQVSYRYTNSIRDTKTKVEYDLFYVKHLSPRMDARIIVRTIGVVLGRQGM